MTAREINELFPQFTTILKDLGYECRMLCVEAPKSPIWITKNTMYLHSEIQAIQTAFNDLRHCFSDVLSSFKEQNTLTVNVGSLANRRKHSDGSLATFGDLIENIGKMMSAVTYWCSQVERLEDELSKPIIRVSD